MNYTDDRGTESLTLSSSPEVTEATCPAFPRGSENLDKTATKNRSTIGKSKGNLTSDLSLVQEKSFAHLIADIAMHLLNRNASIIYMYIFLYA